MFYCLLEVGLIWFGPCWRSKGEKKIIDLWSNTRTVYESCPLYCQIFSQLTLPCCAGLDLVVQTTTLRIINVTFWSEKKRTFPLFGKKRGGSHLWNAMIPPYMCTEDVKTLHTTALSNCGKPMFTYLGGKIHKCMKCSLHMYPTNPPPCPQERNYLFICLLV